MENVCVITGATGYIGSRLLKKLLSEKWKIYVVADNTFGYDNIKDVINDIFIFEYNGDINTLITFFQKTNPDVVFHLAAAVLSSYKPTQVQTLIQSNVQFGTEVLEAMKHSSTRLFINTGSYWQNYNSELYNPVDLYAATKEAFEKIIKFYVESYQFRTINLRLFDVYGEDDNRPKLLNLLVNSIQDSKVLDLSPGEQMLDIVHISDVCNAYLNSYELLLNKPEIKNEVFNVSTGKLISVKDLVELIQQRFNIRLNVNFGGRAYRDREIMIPNRLFPMLPNWSPLINIQDGIDLLYRKFNQ
jgi:CDP-3, 6-dideoxy-D-glycero-L-glycero-4-hexulose-4-reductase